MSLNRTFDRCDAAGTNIDQYENTVKAGCGAQAFVKVVNAEGMDLLFCGHHYAKNEFALVEQGFVVDTDARAELLDHNRLVGSEN